MPYCHLPGLRQPGPGDRPARPETHLEWRKGWYAAKKVGRMPIWRESVFCSGQRDVRADVRGPRGQAEVAPLIEIEVRHDRVGVSMLADYDW